MPLLRIGWKHISTIRRGIGSGIRIGTPLVTTNQWLPNDRSLNGMNLPKKLYYWSYEIKADRKDDRGIQTVSQFCVKDDNLAAAIEQATNDAFHFLANYGAVEIVFEATCKCCGGVGTLPVKMKRVIGRRKPCPDCKGESLNCVFGPIKLVPGEMVKVVHKEQVAKLRIPPPWKLKRELKAGDEITLRTDQGESGNGELFNKDGYVCRSWPDGEILGVVQDHEVHNMQLKGGLTYQYV